MAAASVAENLAAIRSRIVAASGGRSVRLVAVSKTKPPEAIQEAYDAGHRDFGENYVQEIVEKAPLLPSDISWRFIGHLQSNKVKQLIQGVPSLASIDSVDSFKLAREIDKQWSKHRARDGALPILIQCNTSGEESKHGLPPDQVCTVVQEIRSQLTNVHVAGLMTIGAPDYSGCRDMDFQGLKGLKEQLKGGDDFELSMGMSNDFETAIRNGSTSVRVGSAIFGAREYAKWTQRPKSPKEA